MRYARLTAFLMLLTFAPPGVLAGPLAVTGEVTQDLHFSPVSSPFGSGSELEWHVELTVKNRSQRTVNFDTVGVFWGALGRRGLKMKTVRTEGAEEPFWKLMPGESHDFDFRTNGYTSRIIADARGKTISFQIAFLFRGALVDSLFVTDLPAINDPRLPNIAKVFLDRQDGKTSHGYRLSFRKIGPP